MRSPRVPWWPGSITTSGGLHIHHLVLGLALVLVSGFLSLQLLTDTPWREVLAVAFGAGAGLVLDEFALLLYLRDVYWSDEGRASVDAVALTALMTSLACSASRRSMPPTPTARSRRGRHRRRWRCRGGRRAAQGRDRARHGRPVHPRAGPRRCMRVARSRSSWARRFYAADSARLARATEREKRLERRRRAWLNRIGGALSPPTAQRGGS